MNNFKKLLASAMALTMVTSVMPATGVNAAVDSAADVTCPVAGPAIENLTDVFGLTATSTSTLDEVLASVVLKEKEVDGTDLYAVDDLTFGDVKVSLLTYMTANNVYYSLEAMTSRAGITNCNFTSDELKVAEYLLNAYDEIAHDLEPALSAAKAITEIGENGSNIDQAETALKGLTDLSYVTNTPRSKQREVSKEIDRLTDLIEEYTGTSLADAEVKTWLDDKLNVIEKIMDRTEVKDGDFTFNVAEDGAEETYDLVNDYIDSIEASTFYRRYSSNEAVADVMEQLEDIATSFEEAMNILDEDENESLAAFVDNRGSSQSKKSVAGLMADMTGSEDSDYFELTLDDYNVFADFKENVIDEFVSFNYRTVGRTTFVSVRYDGNYGAFIGDDEVTDLLEMVEANFFTAADSDGNTKYDRFVEYYTNLNDYLEAITTGIEGMDAINVAVDDRDAIVAADDALYYLGGYEDTNFTREQARAKRDANRKVEELLEAYRSKFGSTGTTTGWVDMGNGNWNYYEADGTAPTKWICTAPNTWYYVQNGNMMRNYWVWRDANSAYYVGDDGVMVYGPTTVNGYELDANGLWHR